jgi:hypothetical protein
MLCTCLISEGINIKNENVGRIYIVDLRCPDTFRQFVARFRKLDVVNVFSILPPERDLRTEFFFPAQFELDENIERARLQARHLIRREIYWQNEYDEDELAFIHDIERAVNYNYDNQIMNLVYKEAGQWKVDVLHVLARIRGRKIATANNCYLYTQLTNAGFEVFRIEHIDVTPVVEESVESQIQIEKLLKEEFASQLTEKMLTDPHLLLNALYRNYKEKGDRHGQARLRTYVPDIIDEDSIPATAWLQLNRRRFDKRSRNRVLRIAKLIYLDVHPTERLPFLQMSDTVWTQHFKQAIYYFESQALESRTFRKQLRTEHKEEIRIKQAIGQLIAKHHGKELTPENLQSLLRPLASVTRTAPDTPPKAINLLALSNAQLVRLVTHTTTSTIQGTGRNRTLLIGQSWSKDRIPLLAAVATAILPNPLKILAFLGG